MKVAALACAAAMLLAAAPTAAAQDAADGASCLRPTAPGEVALLDELGDWSSTMHTFGDGALGPERSGTSTLGVLDACPEVDSGGGTTVIAGYAHDRYDKGIVRLRAAVREGGNDFAAPVELQSRAVDAGTDVSVAVGPDGDAIVAWTQVRVPNLDPYDEGFEEPAARLRILAVRRPLGGKFGPVEVVQDWRSTRYFVTPFDVVTGVDAAGNATVAWTFAEPSRAESQGPRATVLTAAAPAAGRFGQARKAFGAAGPEQSGLALEVAPSGRALLAWTSSGRVTYVERPSASVGFGAPGAVAESDFDFGTPPAVALRDDGAALIGWITHTSEGLTYQASRRSPGTEFAEPQTLASYPLDVDGASSAFLVYAYGGSGRAVLPTDDAVMRAAIGDDGSLLLTWIGQRREDGDHVASAYAARGSLADGLGPPRRLGSACRAVSGVVPLALSGSTARVAWVDNASVFLFGDVEFPTGAGRLHVTDLAAPGPTGAAPTVTAHPPRRTLAVYSDSTIKLPVECDRACDVRAWIDAPRRIRVRGDVFEIEGPAAAAGVSIPAAGERADVELNSMLGFNIAPRRPRPVEIRLRTCDPATGASQMSSTTVRLRRRALPPIPELYDVKARRVGPWVLVSWKTVEPARRAQFVVTGADPRIPDDAFDQDSSAFVPGDDRTSFLVRIEQPRRQRKVTVIAAGVDRFDKARSVTVEIDG